MARITFSKRLLTEANLARYAGGFQFFTGRNLGAAILAAAERGRRAAAWLHHVYAFRAIGTSG